MSAQCSGCGAELEGTEKFCGHCGRAVPVASQPAAAPEAVAGGGNANAISRLVLLWGLLGLALTAAGVARWSVTERFYDRLGDLPDWFWTNDVLVFLLNSLATVFLLPLAVVFALAGHLVLNGAGLTTGLSAARLGTAALAGALLADGFQYATSDEDLLYIYIIGNDWGRVALTSFAASLPVALAFHFLTRWSAR